MSNKGPEALAALNKTSDAVLLQQKSDAAAERMKRLKELMAKKKELEQQKEQVTQGSGEKVGNQLG